MEKYIFLILLGLECKRFLYISNVLLILMRYFSNIGSNLGTKTGAPPPRPESPSPALPPK